jgi:hypothetical protein
MGTRVSLEMNSSCRYQYLGGTLTCWNCRPAKEIPSKACLLGTFMLELASVFHVFGVDLYDRGGGGELTPI